MHAINSWLKNGHCNFAEEHRGSVLRTIVSCVCYCQFFTCSFARIFICMWLLLLLRMFKYRFQLTSSHFESMRIKSNIWKRNYYDIVWSSWKVFPFFRTKYNTKTKLWTKIKETHTLNKLNFIALSVKY